MARSPAGCLGWLFAWVLPKAEQDEAVEASESRYLLRDDFLSPAEANFLRVLRQAADDFLICPKVRLADLFFVARARGSLAAHNRLAAKHLDFLLCDTQTLRPRLGIELDDASHQREDRRSRDAFVDLVLYPFRGCDPPAGI